MIDSTYWPLITVLFTTFVVLFRSNRFVAVVVASCVSWLISSTYNPPIYEQIFLFVALSVIFIGLVIKFERSRLMKNSLMRDIYTHQGPIILKRDLSPMSGIISISDDTAISVTVDQPYSKGEVVALEPDGDSGIDFKVIAIAKGGSGGN